MQELQWLSLVSHEDAFLNRLTQLLGQMSDQRKLNQAILECIREYAKEHLFSLLKLSETNPMVKKYCNLRHAAFIKFWNKQLSSDIAFTRLGIAEVIFGLAPQPKIPSLHLIKAGLWFAKSREQYGKLLENEEKGNQFFQFARLAIKHGSYHAGCLLLETYLTRPNPLTLQQIEMELAHLANLHGTPGHLLLAKLYARKDMPDQARIQIDQAELKFSASLAAINNTECTPAEVRQIITQLKQTFSQAETSAPCVFH